MAAAPAAYAYTAGGAVYERTYHGNIAPVAPLAAYASAPYVAAAPLAYSAPYVAAAPVLYKWTVIQRDRTKETQGFICD